MLKVGEPYSEQGAILKDDITGQTSDIGPTSGTVNTADILHPQPTDAGTM